MLFATSHILSTQYPPFSGQILSSVALKASSSSALLEMMPQHGIQAEFCTDIWVPCLDRKISMFLHSSAIRPKIVTCLTRLVSELLQETVLNAKYVQNHYLAVPECSILFIDEEHSGWSDLSLILVSVLPKICNCGFLLFGLDVSNTWCATS